MKKYIKRIITACVFVIIMAAALTLLSPVFVPKSNDPGSPIEALVPNGILGEPADTVDVLFLGDSEAYCTFIPLQIWKDTGYTSYNSASSAQTLDYSLTMLNRALAGQDLKIVFLDVNAFYRKESKEILYAKLCGLFPIFNYHDRWKNLTREDFTEMPEYTWTDASKGYRYSAEIVPSNQANYLNFEKTEEKSRITVQNKRYVKEIKKVCDRNGIRLVLISAPSSSNFTYKRHNASTAFAEELGCEFIDMNFLTDELQLDWSKDTRDKGDHLNHTGALKATAWMSEYLTQTGLLTSHKDDPAYAGWDDALAFFESNIVK